MTSKHMPPWHLSRKGEQVGPMPHRELLKLAETGRLHPDDLVWRPGFEAWRKASSVPGLLSPPSLSINRAPPPQPNAVSDTLSKVRGRQSLIMRLVWPDVSADAGKKSGRIQGYIALAWAGLSHLIEVLQLYSVANYLRINAKLPAMDFAEFLRGNTLAQVSLGAFAVIIVLLLFASRYRRTVFWVSFIWTCFHSALMLVFNSTNPVAWAIAPARVLLAINGVRAA